MSDDYAIQRYRGYLAIVWWENGRRHRHSLGTADRATAEAAARAFWTARTLGGRIRTVGDAVEAYLDTHRTMLSHHRATQAWTAAKPYWGAIPITKVDEETSTGYPAWRKHVKAITARNELAVIRAAINWAHKKGLITTAPFIKMPGLPDRDMKHLSRDQFRKLLEGAVGPHVRLFMQLAIGTGARTNALLDLTWDRVDLQRRLITLNPRDRVQTSKYRATVPINDQLYGTLIEAKEGAIGEFVIEYGGAQVKSVKKGFAAACERSGVKASPHMLRHSAAVWMAENGVPMSQIAKFLGHSNSLITEQHYARFSPTFLSKAAESLVY